eukprot:316501-Prorocentrum_minimum.AAC.2
MPARICPSDQSGAAFCPPPCQRGSIHLTNRVRLSAGRAKLEEDYPALMGGWGNLMGQAC